MIRIQSGVELTQRREMAIGNTFGATALSSYGGFWLSFAVVLTPGGFEIMTTLESEGGAAMYYNSFGLYLMVSAHSLTCFLSPLEHAR